jgi:hypothetical protein
MLSLQNLKVAPLCNASFTNGATATGSFDTLGYDEVLVAVTLSTSDAVTNNPSVFKLQEGDTTSSYADITAAVGDTAWTIPNANTESLQTFLIHVTNKPQRKRYLKLLLSPVTTQIVSAVAYLGRAKSLPDTTTEQGSAYSLNI